MDIHSSFIMKPTWHVVGTLSDVCLLCMGGRPILFWENGSLCCVALSSTIGLSLSCHCLVLSFYVTVCSLSLLLSLRVGNHPHVYPVYCGRCSIDLLPTSLKFWLVSNLYIPIYPMPYWVLLMLVCQCCSQVWTNVSSPIWFVLLYCQEYCQHFVGPVI